MDTNWESINQIDLLIKAETLGFRTKSNSFKAQDFGIEWSFEPLSVDVDGDIGYDPGTLEIDIFLVDSWYRIWPLF